MTDKEFKILAKKYEDGAATEIEKEKFEEAYRLISERHQDWDPALMGDEEKVKEEVAHALNRRIESFESRRKKSTFYKYITVAASIAVFALGCWVVYNKTDYRGEELENTVLQNSLYTTPSEKIAYLTLDNGEHISLEELSIGEVIMQNGVSVTKVSQNELLYAASGKSKSIGSNSLSIPKGQQYQITLADGTSLWLNAASKLEYPINFQAHSQRKLTLDGEAYFEVSKDEERPFIVATRNQEVTVLGTHFNVNAYVDEPTIRTTLLEGKVNVRAANSGSTILAPGEQATLSSNGRMTVRAVDAELAVAWKDQQFIFESERIESVMRMIERRYDVEVVYKGDKTTERFGGGFSKFDDVSKVLKSLESTGKVRFEIEGKRIVVLSSILN